VALKARPHSELVVRLIGPFALWLVRVLARRGVNPLAVVILHSFLGLVAAALIASRHYEHWLVAALLLQLKTLLDNVDGGLARYSGRVTVMGRYADTVMDTLVNLALFVALAAHGPLLWSGLAYLTLMVILSLDFNAERLYREARQESPPRHGPGAAGASSVDVPGVPAVPDGAPAWLLEPFRAFYRVLLQPQDRLIARLDRRYFERLSAKRLTDAPKAYRLAWNGTLSTAALVNLGLSSQLFLLGLFLVLGHPYGYVISIAFQAAYVASLQAARGILFKRYLGGFRAHA
jgi:phosphatidylglycerophosphate synthase